jgi:TatD DNase family protein
MLVDSHCHLDMLDLDSYEGGLDGVLTAAREHGVGHMLCVSVSLEDYPAMLSLSEPYDQVSVSVGVHPNHRNGKEPDVEDLIRLARHGKVIAIGETGLDYFRSEGDLEWQRERMRRHITAARLSGKPLIIHTRDARVDTLGILQEEHASEAGGVMHCFAEDWDVASKALDLGFYISFSGIVTFRNAGDLREVAKKVPADRLLVETDCPYLAPVPYRGKPNQPAWVRFVAEQIAELRGESLEELASTTTANFNTLFGTSVAV